MATLIVVGGSDGSRRCDAKCHNASSIDCDCVCGGRYHGLGGSGARRQISEDVLGVDFTRILEQFDRRAQELGGSIEVVAFDSPSASDRTPAGVQLSLQELLA